MYYRHDLDYTYPERSDSHMLSLERTRPLKLDENYEYMPHGAAFRKRKGWRRIFGKGPFVDLHIAEPIYADKTLSPRESAEELRKRAYIIMQHMNGIDPGAPTYNEDQSIENYQKTM